MKTRVKLKHLKNDIKAYAEIIFEDEINKKKLVNSYVEVMYDYCKHNIKNWYE